LVPKRQHKIDPPDPVIEKQYLIFAQSDAALLIGVSTPAFFLSFSR